MQEENMKIDPLDLMDSLGSIQRSLKALATVQLAKEFYTESQRRGLYEQYDALKDLAEIARTDADSSTAKPDGYVVTPLSVKGADLTLRKFREEHPLIVKLSEMNSRFF